VTPGCAEDVVRRPISGLPEIGSTDAHIGYTDVLRRAAAAPMSTVEFSRDADQHDRKSL
jgi:hypothetical protein